jgi:hypothetical protein
MGGGMNRPSDAQESIPASLASVRTLLSRAIPEAAQSLGISADESHILLLTAEAQLALPLPANEPNEGDDSSQAPFGYTLVVPPEPGKFSPRLLQFKLSPLVACICGAIGAVAGGLTPVGWAMVAAVTAIGIRDIWAKKVEFGAEHGQVLFELYQSSNKGKAHDIERDHLLANVQASRRQAQLPPMDRATFDMVVGVLLASGVVAPGRRDGTVRWTELTLEIPR